MTIQVGQDTAKTRKTLDVNGTSIAYYSIPAATEAGLGDFSKLPAALKVVLENMLRFEDGKTVTLDDIKAFAFGAIKKRPTIGGTALCNTCRHGLGEQSDTALARDIHPDALWNVTSKVAGEPGVFIFPCNDLAGAGPLSLNRFEIDPLARKSRRNHHACDEQTKNSKASCDFGEKRHVGRIR